MRTTNGTRWILALAVTALSISGSIGPLSGLTGQSPAAPHALRSIPLGSADRSTSALHPELRTNSPWSPLPAAATYPLEPVGIVGVGSYPWNAAYDTAKGEIFVSDSFETNVTVLSDVTNRVIATVAVGPAPLGLAYDSRLGEIFVANSGSNNVSVISDTSLAVTANIALPAGTLPTAVVYDSGTNTVWALTFNGQIYVIADVNNTVVKTVTFPVSRLGVLGGVYDARRGEVYISSYNFSSVLYLWDSNYSYGIITVGTNPVGMAYDPAQGYVYVADTGQGTVSVINDTTHVPFATSIGRIWEPEGVAYDRTDGYVFVTSVNTSQTVVIDAASNTQVGSVPNYLGANGTGVVWDTGAATGYVVDSGLDAVTLFARTVPITFSESGLPSGTSWIVWLNGTSTKYGPQNLGEAGTLSTLVAYATNGTYVFAVNPIPGFLANPVSGTVTVAGAAQSISIVFSELYNITFTETGLPGGTTWSVSLNGNLQSSVQSSITFHEVNGSYSFNVGAVAGYQSTPSQGPVTVDGGVVNRAIAFNAVAPLWFNETGLPTGTSWTVTITGAGSFTGSMTNTSTTASVEFWVSLGYQGRFAIPAPSGFTPSPGSGSVSTPSSGAPTTETITFVADLKIDSFVATPSSVKVGDELTLKVSISGGAAPFLYAYSQLPAGCQSQNSSSLVCAPNAVGLSIVIVTVSDRLGLTAEANVSVQVGAAGSNSSSQSTPSYLTYGIIAVIVVAIAVAALAMMMRRRRPPPSRDGPAPAAAPVPPSTPTEPGGSRPG